MINAPAPLRKYRRAKASEIAFGDATYHRERVAQMVVDAEQAPSEGQEGVPSVGMAHVNPLEILIRAAADVSEQALGIFVEVEEGGGFLVEDAGFALGEGFVPADCGEEGVDFLEGGGGGVFHGQSF